MSLNLGERLFLSTESNGDQPFAPFFGAGVDVPAKWYAFENAPKRFEELQYPKKEPDSSEKRSVIPKRFCVDLGAASGRVRSDIQSGTDVLAFSTGRDKVVCRFYLMNKCRAGDACPFYHPPVVEKQQAICKFFLGGRCVKGDKCPFSHDLKRVPCNSFFLLGGCRHEDSCRFFHGTEDELTEEMKGMLETSRARMKLS